MTKPLSFLKSPPILFAIAHVIVVAALALADWPLDWRSSLWAWLGTQSGGALETNSTTLRNVGFIVAGLLALVFAYWRSVVADRQARASEQQAGTAERSLLNERYQKGAEMLGSPILSVRLGGIFALKGLAAKYPLQYHTLVMDLLCTFVRYPTPDERADADMFENLKESYQNPNLRGDLQAVLNIIVERSEEMVAIERGQKYYINLDYANLFMAYFDDANLNHASLRGTDLTGAFLLGANLRHAFLDEAILTDTYFSLDGEDSAWGLTQGQLTRAFAYDHSPPNLDGVLDAETGEQLKWNGRSLDPPS